jgi:hypothetical protein
MRLAFLLPFASTALLLMAAGFSDAATWYVKADGTGDRPTIQAAIESAAQDDTVLVGPGVYSWSSQGTGDEYGMIRIMRDWPRMTIVGEQGAEMTILDGEHQGRIFFYQGHYPSFPGGLTIDGFTFTRGRATQAGNLVGGGFTAHLSSPIIKNSIFTFNSSDQGGAYWYGGWGAPQLINCLFEGNTARYGAAVFMINSPLTTLISNCVIKNNDATSYGGGVFGYNVPLVMEYCTIARNNAPTNGGGMALQNCEPSMVSFCTFYQNQSGAGGGIALMASTDLSVDNTIIANSVSGGAAWLHETTSMTFSCSDLFANNGGNWTGPIAGQAGVDGNFSADPLFCGALSLDFLLKAGSPCAPGNHPDGFACSQIGAHPVGCGGVPVRERTWGAIKSMYSD